MIEFLTANWLWILLGIGVLWFLVRGRGMGCGTGGHSHGSERSPRKQADLQASAAGGQAGATHDHGAGGNAPSRRRGGC